MEATKPPKLPVTALVTAPKPVEGEVQVRREPEPVHVPAVPELEDEVEVDVAAVSAMAEVVVAATADMACFVLGKCLKL